jgi:hypothetical protein
MNPSNSAPGAVQLSSQSDVPTSSAIASQMPRSGAEPERVPAISKAQAGGHCVTRRSVMNLMVGVTAAVIGSPKYSVSQADPIFDLIEAHREANAAMNASYSEQSRLEEELPNDLTRSMFSAWETTIVETDDPRWTANQRNVHMACEADTETALALIQEPPATVEGAIALLQYVAAIECEYIFPDGKYEDGDGNEGSWSFFLHKNLAKTFAAHREA